MCMSDSDYLTKLFFSGVGGGGAGSASAPRTVTRNFSIGGLCSSAGELFVCAEGLDIIKLTKTPLIYSVSRFNLGSLELCLGG